MILTGLLGPKDLPPSAIPAWQGGVYHFVPEVP